jgi:opacity protein-like surface antigen
VSLPAAAGPRILAVAALVASLVSVGCASTASPGEEPGAAQDSSFARPGPYLGLYGVKSYEQFSSSSAGVRFGNSDLGAGLRLGYRATPDLAVEVIAEDVKGFALSDGTAKADLDLLNFGVMGKYFLLTERVQPYLLAGVGVARSDVRRFNYDHDGGFLRGGLGADVYLTTNFAVFGEANYNRMMGGVSDLHHIDLQAGILFRF